ncbi:cytochrome P450 [Amycolatopsis sp. lyj-109]|uniref:cytochrome P450 n=1 Tax=Amycolatopsis sp. lyj-109 TaxID=2789287 RepID=UPI00397D4951
MLSSIRSKIPLRVFRMIARRPGGTARFDFFGATLIVVSTAESVDHVLTNTGGYSKDAPMYAAARPFLGQSLTVSRGGDDWRRRRRVVQPLFHHSRRPAHAAAVERSLEDVVEHWAARAESASATNLAQEMRRLCLRIACRTLFEVDEPHDVDALLAAFDTISEHVVTLASTPRRARAIVPGNRRFRAAMSRVEAFVERALSQGLPSMIVDNAVREKMSPRDLRDELVGLLFAGHGTLADTLTWALHLTMHDPAVAAAVRAEALTVLSGRIASFDDVPRLPYTRAVVHEAMRLYPVVWLSMRRAVRADVVAGRDVPAGALVVWSPYVVNRDRAVGPEPERFRPERFEVPASARGLIRDASGVRPFGAGARACAGADLAYSEACVTLSTLLRNHQLIPHGRAANPPRLGMTLRPGKDPWAVIREAG